MAVAGIEATLVSIHALLAHRYDVPEIVLTDSEARTLAEAVAEVSKHYRIPSLSPGQAALAGLFATAVHVYRPKVKELVQRKRRAQQPARQADPSPVSVAPVQPAAQATPWFESALTGMPTAGAA